MSARFQSTWFDIDGQEYRIKIHDDAYSSPAVEQTLDGALPGFTLDYESDVDQPYQGIIASTCSIYLINNGGAFDTWLQSIPSLSGENDVTMTLERNTSGGFRLEWAGIIMVDQIEMEDMPNPSLVKLVANDGTSFLKTIREVPTSTTSGGIEYLTNPNVINWLQNILQRIPTAVHWNQSYYPNFIRAWTDFKPENWGNSVADGGQGTQGFNILEYTRCTGALDPNTINVLDGIPEPYSDWTFLQSLCMLFNARFCLANGEWHFWPVNQHLMVADDQNLQYLHRAYKKNNNFAVPETLAAKGEFATRVTPQLGPPTTAGRYVQLSGGRISHTVPLKNFRRSRPYSGSSALNTTIRTGSSANLNIPDNGRGLADFNAPQSFFTGAVFTSSGNIQVSRSGQGGYSGPANTASLRLKINLDVGSYRYQIGSNSWSTNQSTDQYLFIGNLGQISSGFDVSLPFELTTAPLTADSETLSCEIEADFVGFQGTSLNAAFEAEPPTTMLGCAITTSLTNDAFQNKLVFQGETSRDNTEEFNQGTLLFGTVDSLGSNSGLVDVSSLYQSGEVVWDMSTWVSQFSSTGEHLNRLCVREAIGLLQSGLPKREGQIKIPSGARIPSPLMTIENEEGTAHFMVTGCSYSADQRIATISRLQIGELDLTDVSDNGSEGEVSDGDDNQGSGSGGEGGATDDDGSGGGAGGTGSGSSGSSSGAPYFAQISQITKNIAFDPDGVVKIKVKSGELPLDADGIDDSTSTKKLTTQAEKDDITNLKGALKTTTGSGGKGVFVNTTKTQSESHVSVDSTSAILQAGLNTKVDMTETSPGVISLKVQAGDGSGSPTSVEGMKIEGHSTFQNAAVTFPQPVTFSSTTTGINATHITGIDDAGSGEIITDAERTKLNGIETGAEANVVTTNLATADQTLTDNRTVDADGNDFTVDINGGGEMTIKDGTNIIAVFSDQGGVRLSGLDYPTSDGSAGQFIKTDGSGNLSFASASGGSGSSPYVLASHSGRAPLYFHSRYYYGSSSFGWATNTPSTQQSSPTVLNDHFAHAGIVLPTSCSEITFKSSIRNDSRADDVKVYLWAADRPNGSTSSMSLTAIGNATASCSSGQDLHYNADISATGLSLTAGQLLFVALYRVGTVNGTTNVNYTYTMMITP